MPGSKDERSSNRLCFLSEKQNLLGNTDEAIESLKKAILLDPSNSTAYSLLGSIFNEKNSSECISYYENALKINQRSYLAYRGMLDCTRYPWQYDYWGDSTIYDLS